jgi:hypothetical protein
VATAAASGQSEADGIDEDEDESVTDSKMLAIRRTRRSIGIELDIETHAEESEI